MLDVIRDKLNLTERTDRLFDLVQKWRPLCAFYEEYGLQADIQHIQTQQTLRNYRFNIYKVGGIVSKVDRIRRLMPLFEQGKIWLPQRRMYTQYDGTTVDLIDQSIEEEFVAHPVSAHDDMLDCLARIEDPEVKKHVKWPHNAMRDAQGRLHSAVSSMSPMSTNPNRAGRRKYRHVDRHIGDTLDDDALVDR